MYILINLYIIISIISININRNTSRDYQCNISRESNFTHDVVDHPCGICNHKTNITDSLCCEGKCNIWFHHNCLHIAEEGYNNTTKGEQSFKWFCKNCRRPGRLPDFQPAKEIDTATWGHLKGHEVKIALEDAYNEIITWRKNLFKVPSGKHGKALISEVKDLINHYVTSTSLESVAMTALMVIFPLLLQKPTKKSKTKDHNRFLEKRLQWWREGNISSLIKEGKAIQNRFRSSSSTNKQNNEKVFARLMLQGKIAAALRWITNSRGTLLKATPQVISTLASKHPQAAPVSDENILKGPIYQVDDVIFEHIDAQAIYIAAKNTNGSAGPSGMDSDGWQRILCSKSFKSTSVDLCEAVADLAKKLATKLVDPSTLPPYTACRLIPLDKNPGVRPIGVGEVLRRIIGKAITTLIKPEVMSATAPLQACAGLQGGVEAAIHALRDIFEDTDSHGILLVDADNAFNALNRSASLENMQIICPEFSVYLINTYRKPAKLIIPESGGEYILSQEGTTQGDNCASGLYACSCMPLMISLTTPPKLEPTLDPPITPAKQVWFADDSAAGGKLDSLIQWWEALKKEGPGYGY